MSLKSHAFHHISIITYYHAFRCVQIDCVLIGLDWAEPMMHISFAFHMFIHFPCIHTLFSIYLLYLNYFETFLIVSLFLPLFLFTLVVSMAPKHKSAPSQNPLCSRALSSSGPTPSHIRFCDEDAQKDFSENFSRRGVYSKRQVILANFADTNLSTVIHSQEWELLCDVSVTYPSVLI